MKKSVLVGALAAGCSWTLFAHSELPDVTAAVQARIDAAWQRGGGEVAIEAGEQLLRPIRLRSNVTLRLKAGAKIRSSRNIEDFLMPFSADPLEPISAETLKRVPGEDQTARSQYALFRAFGAVNVRVIGEPGSEVDGRNCYDAKGGEGYRGPHTFWATCSTNVVMEGVTVVDSADYAFKFFRCRGVKIDRAKATGGHDGIHFDCCEQVKIVNSEILTGDDCVAGAGCSDILVTNCVLSSACSPFRLGGRNVLVDHCRAYGPAPCPHRWTLTPEQKARGAGPAEVEGLRATGAFYQGYTGDIAYKGFYPGNIIVRNTTVHNVERFLVSLSGIPDAIWQDGNGIADITFENVKATAIGMPSVVVAKAKEPLRLTLRNCSFAFRDPVPQAFLLGNIQVIEEGVTVKNAARLVEQRSDITYEDIPEFPSWRIESKEQRAQWGMPPLKTKRGTSAAQQFLPLAKAQVTGGFWASRYELWRTKTVADVLTKLATKSSIEKNLRNAAARKGGHSGAYFFDGLFCEAVCGASDYLLRYPDAELEKRLDGIIDLIVAAQRPDGYLNTRVQALGEKHRWGDNGACGLDQHEIYDAGCLLEAGIHHYRATGKTKLLAAGIRFANLLVATIGPSPKRNLIPGHSLTEDAIVQFADLLAEDPTVAAKAGFPGLTAKPYLDLVYYWLGNHGNNCGEPNWEKLGTNGAIKWCIEATKKPHPLSWRPSYGDYQMDRKPLSEYFAIEGHAVRATLLCTGIAAYARVAGDGTYAALALRFWESMVGRKMYISGGVGSQPGLERFIGDYQLPCDAYLETCAAIGSAFFSLRMAELTGEGRYFDEAERVVYNALLTAVGSNGTTYTYQNPLNTRKGSRWDWHGCPCCPPMFLKLTGRLPSVACAQDDEGYRVNLFMDGTYSFKDLRLVQETRYPEDGKVRIRIGATAPRTFALKVRVPGWARGCENPLGLYVRDAGQTLAAPRLTVNGQPFAEKLQNGYAVLRREWREGDVVELTVDVGERLIRADERVSAVRGKVARMRGPVLMALENGKWIPYYDVANNGPAPHEVWVKPAK